MRKNKFMIIAALGSMLGIASCTDDLEVTPIDPNNATTEEVFSNINGYTEALAKLYASYAVSGQQGPAGNPDIAGLDEGFSNYIRLYFNLQELPTDEAVMAWNDQTIKDFHSQTWSPNDVYNNTMYSRIFFSIALENEFIRDANANMARLSGGDVAIANQYIAECRFLRALSYWHAIDMYGNPPFITEADLPGSSFPTQITRANLFAYIESELKAIEGLLAAPGQAGYGHADQAAAWALLARLYLNASVYVGTDYYTDCITYCNKVIDSGVYSLNPTYKYNFNAQNGESPEFIFAINYDAVHTQTFGGTPYILHAAIGGDMTANQYGINGGWAGLRTTSALVNKFVDIDTSGVSPDSRAQFFTSGQTLEIADIGTFSNGWAVIKFTNLNNDGSGPDPVGDFVDTDFPIFRLADVYLMYAEAVLRGGSGGDMTTALGYLNALRERAFGNSNFNVSTVDLNYILDERARELYWEGIRRTDLIRFGQFTNGSYVWPWKGGIASGTQTDAYRNLYPIPTQDLLNNPNLVQNPGY